VSAAAGHSFGELVALWAAGVLDEPTFFRLVAARGRALTPPPGVDGGGMAALRCDLAAATALLAEHPALSLANHNGPTQVVIGGPTPALERLLASRADGEFVRLDVAAAFHTPSVAWAEAPWRAALAQAAFAPPAFPVYADGAAQPYPVDPDAAREALARQPFEPVRFDALLRRMYDDGVRLFVEVGPGTALTGMVARALGDDALAVPLLPDSQPDALDQALLRLLVAGVPVRPQHEAPPPPRPRSAATVQLAGPHLVPPSRRAALEGALSSPLSPLVPAAGHVERPGAAPDLAALVPAGGPATRPNLAPVERPSAPDLVQDLELATLAAHERYLQVELSHTALLTELAARGDDALLLRLQAHQEALHSTHRAFLEGQRAQVERLSGGRWEPPRPTAWPAQPTRPEAPPRSVAPIPSVHAAPEPARPQPAPVAPEAPRPATSPVEQVRDALYAVLSEQTGYPAEVFLPGMDLEADLGVDSIKRVAILGAAGRKLGLAEVPRGLRDARSLGEVLDALAAATAPSPASPSPAGPSARDLLFELVAERTGYPAEVLLPEMDLEADLGIDSIKRVAILGAAGQKLGLAEVPRGLRDARSLGEVLDALTAAMAPPAAPAGPSARDLLLEIVAERTGYPAEVLLPEMDLEADLGIDSIKRVALLAEVGKRLELNEAVDRARLRELRTLGEVLGLFTSLAPSAPQHLDTGAAPRPAAAPGTSVTPLSAPRPNSGALPRSPTPPRATSTLPTRRLLRLEPLPPPRPLPRVLPDRHHVLVVSDDAAALAALVAALAARELPLVAMWAGDDEAPELPEWVDWVTLPGRDEVALQRTLDWVHHNLGPTAALLLAPTAAAHDRRWLGLALLLVRFLQPALQASAGAVVLGVRLDGALGRRGSPRALAAGLLGLTRTLRHELPEVSSRLVDLGPGAPVELLVPELLDADPSEALVGYDGGQRAGLRFADAPREGAAVELRPDRVVLVTGGARGITAACAVALAEATGGRYLLIGRTPLPAEPAWATGLEGPALRGAAARALAVDGRPSPRAIEELARTISQAREVRDTLAALAACGAEARYAELDLSAPDVAALDAARSGWGPVHTLLHGAGALADGPLSTRSLATLDRVFGPKVDGLDALLRWLDAAPPARVVLFSSVAASHGNAGQADYAMANAVLDQTAAALAARWPGAQATSLAWGPWDGGMVTPELRERFLARGVGVIPRDAGAAACVWEVLHPGAPHVILGEAPLPPEPAPRAVTLRSALSLSRLPLLDDHRIGGGAVLPAAWAMGWMLDAAAALWPGHTEVHDLRVLRGVRLADDEERALLLDLRPEDGHVSARLRSFVDGREQLHYAATLHPPTSRAAPPPPVAAAVTADPAAWREACVLRYGPAFPTPTRLLTLDERGAALGFDACPAPARWYEPGSDVNPWAYELATHAALVWLWERHRTACLPLVTGRFTPLRPLPAGAPFVVSVQIDSFTPDEVCFGFAVYDLAGEALAVGAELRMTPVPPDSPLWGR
jgi:NAD(P)-dependent dehydrogenase (short-subunit alcohol dehydrogenase family)/acyl carrier protein